jgi:hypothetical protein
VVDDGVGVLVIDRTAPVSERVMAFQPLIGW